MHDSDSLTLGNNIFNLSLNYKHISMWTTSDLTLLFYLK
jgi:hypothetical protein